FASIACWLCAQFPQIITNYRNKSVDGLSLYFLMNWLLGDLANLVGCILTKQLPFQVYLAIYFCSVDFGLFFQYFYYSWFYPRQDDEYVSIEPEDQINQRYSMSSLRSSILEDHNDNTPNDSINSGMLIGRTMAWACAVLYLTSRMPQIWKNYTRRSVEGLSIFMFIFAALGNLTYTLYIFTNPEAIKNPSSLREAVPYILGSV
ncbi:15370_t:CDS:2, partial [Dentiscutata heterogama]